MKTDAQTALLQHVRAATSKPAFTLTLEGSAPSHTKRALSWSELDRWSRQWCALLQARNVKPGDHVAVLAPSCLELVAVLVAHHRMGVVHVPINTRYKQREVDHIVGDSGARFLADAALLATLHGYEPTDVADDVATDDESTAMLIYTSGTTGPSKGVALPFRAIASGIGALTKLWQWTADDVLALALPLFHVHGLCIGVHGTLLHGMQAEIHPRFEAGAIVDACGRGATIFMGVPTMYRRLLAYLEAAPEHQESRSLALSKARLFTSGSAALPAADHRLFQQFTGHAILERYGMSETLLTLSNPYDGERRPGSVGFPVPGVQARIVDGAGVEVEVGQTGELAVRGPSVMTGYHGLVDATAKAFVALVGTDGKWFMTGDAAATDSDGYIRLIGRKSVDILKCGGFKISAREIEDVLLEADNVVETAVVGLADPEWGQRIVAVVVLRASADPMVVAQTLTEHCQAQLAKFKCPRDIHVWTELPRNALGKVQKHRIIERLGNLPMSASTAN